MWSGSQWNGAFVTIRKAIKKGGRGSELASILWEICPPHNTYTHRDGGRRGEKEKKKKGEEEQEEKKKSYHIPPMLERLPSAIWMVPRSEWPPVIKKGRKCSTQTKERRVKEGEKKKKVASGEERRGRSTALIPCDGNPVYPRYCCGEDEYIWYLVRVINNDARHSVRP